MIRLLFLVLFSAAYGMEKTQEDYKNTQESTQKLSIDEMKRRIFVNWAQKIFPELDDITDCDAKATLKDYQPYVTLELFFPNTVITNTFDLEEKTPKYIIALGMFKLKKMLGDGAVNNAQLILLLNWSDAKRQNKSMIWDSEKEIILNALPEVIREAAELDPVVYKKSSSSCIIS